MATKVTLNIFSGRPNPSWVLTGEDEKQLIERLAVLEEVTDKRPSGVYGGLGYRGFTITRPASHPQGRLAVTVHERIVDRPGDFNVLDRSDTESFLVETARGRLPEVVSEYLAQNTGPAATDQKFAIPAPAAAKCPVCKAVDAPAYTPGTWNTPAVQPKNNCYNYANNKITNTFAQPGRAHGKQATLMACPNVLAAAKADGLVQVSNFTAPLPKGRGWYVALVVWPNADYHWYRQDKVGCWSHKPGQTAARNTDNSGKAIADPKTCNRGPYIHFCTYMVRRPGTVIK